LLPVHHHVDDRHLGTLENKVSRFSCYTPAICMLEGY
jgi:hypothetical protein